jgi:hypothetical protein
MTIRHIRLQIQTDETGTKCARDCVHHEEAMYDDGTVAMAMCRAFGFDELRWDDDGESARHPDCIAAERDASHAALVEMYRQDLTNLRGAK